MNKKYFARLFGMLLAPLLFGACENVVPTFGTQFSQSVKVKSLVAGDRTACVVTEDRMAYCWGSNWGEIIGRHNDKLSDYSSEPVELAPLQTLNTLGVSQISIGEHHVCALTDTKEIFCWGESGSGEVGQATLPDRYSKPVKVAGLERVISLDVGDKASCAVDESGDVYCWGYLYSQDTSNWASHGVPEKVNSLSGKALKVAVGDSHICALMAQDSSVKCWGGNYEGQFGDGGYGSEDYIPRAVQDNDLVNLTGIVSFSAGGRHTCALAQDSGILCWGANENSQSGEMYSAGPTAVVLSTMSSNHQLYATALKEENSTEFKGAVQVASGENFSCARKSSGEVYCWGANWSGQLGRGHTDGQNQKFPKLVVGLYDATHLAVGSDFACAVSESQGVVCWGSDTEGQVGSRAVKEYRNPDRELPALLNPGEILSKVAANDNGGCVAKYQSATLNSEIVCWGQGMSHSPLQNNADNPTAPVVVGSVPGNVEKLDLGYDHGCAITNNFGTKEAYCWGYNNNRILGVGNYGIYPSGGAIPQSGGNFYRSITLDGNPNVAWISGSYVKLAPFSNLGSSIPVAFGSSVMDFHVGDFNNDGVDDIAAIAGSNFKLVTGNGDGTFGAATSSGVSSGGLHQVGDIDSDGDLDFVFNQSNYISIQENDGTGYFGSSGNNILNIDLGGGGGGHLDGMVMSDFDRDGKLNVAAIYHSSGYQLRIYRIDNASSGVDVVGTYLDDLGGTISKVFANDLDGDGVIEIIAETNEYSQRRAKMYNFDGANLIFRGDIELGSNSGTIELVDIDKNGIKDILNYYSSGGEIFKLTLGSGGVFQNIEPSPIYYSVSMSTQDAVAVGPNDDLVSVQYDGYYHFQNLSIGGANENEWSPPRLVRNSSGEPFTDVQDIAVGRDHTCLVADRAWGFPTLDRGVTCWGQQRQGRFANGMGNDYWEQYPGTYWAQDSGFVELEQITKISAGSNYTCALDESSNLYCWGGNENGQLGIVNNNMDELYAQHVMTSASNVETGDYHTCAQLSNGSVQCWGAGWDGQLGNGNDNQSDQPVNVLDAISKTPVMNANDLSLGRNHTCISRAEGGGNSLYCFGNNSRGQLGGYDHRSLYPELVGGLGPMNGFASGSEHTCAIVNLGVRCWGSNSQGQLGVLDAPLNYPSPNRVRFY